MPRGMMDMRMMDGRNPYGSRGGYVVSSRRGRRGGRRDRAMDRGMDYGYDRRDYRDYADAEYDTRRGDYAYSQYDNAMDGRDYQSDRQSDMARGDYADMRDRADYEGDMARRGRDGHHMGRSEMYRPIEAMGYFTGYYGGGEDMARGGRGRGRDYADYAGDYGENLTKEELEQWRMKLDKEVGDEQSKHFFKKENIEQKARQMGIEMKHFNADELAIASYMLYSDFCKSLKPYVGQNMDVFVKMGEEFLTDPDSEVKGGEKLALYFEIVSGD